MDDADRFRLLGLYRTPRFRIGQRVRCHVRGEVIITGISDAPIPWPIAKGGRGRHSLVVYKGLARGPPRSRASYLPMVGRPHDNRMEVAESAGCRHRHTGH